MLAELANFDAVGLNNPNRKPLHMLSLTFWGPRAGLLHKPYDTVGYSSILVNMDVALEVVGQ